MPSPPPYRNRSRSRSPGRQPSGSSSTTARPRAPKQLDIYKSRPSSSRADPLDSLPPRGATGGSYRRGPADEDDYRSRADRRAGRGDDGGRGGGLPYGGGGARDDDRRGGYGGRDDERDRRGGSSYRDDDRRRPDDRDRDRDGRGGGGGYGRPREQDGPSTSSSSARAPPFPAPAASAPPAAAAAAPAAAAPPPRMMAGTMIEVIANDRLGRKVRVKCSPNDTVGDLKKLIAAQSGTNHKKVQLKKWNTIFKNHITLADYEIHDGMSLELY